MPDDLGIAFDRAKQRLRERRAQRDLVGIHDIGTSAGGRAYIAEFFATRLRRHDFQRYIEERLAADFACALAEYLSEQDKLQQRK